MNPPLEWILATLSACNLLLRTSAHIKDSNFLTCHVNDSEGTHLFDLQDCIAPGTKSPLFGHRFFPYKVPHSHSTIWVGNEIDCNSVGTAFRSLVLSQIIALRDLTRSFYFANVCQSSKQLIFTVPSIHSYQVFPPREKLELNQFLMFSPF